MFALFSTALAFEKYSFCPGSGATEHTMAQGSLYFQSTCAEVSEEIIARAQMQDGWEDPHNHGHYKLLANNMQTTGVIETWRRTGNNEYVDKQTFKFEAAGSGCMMYMCSESQGQSNNDQGTNMCNMFDLFCNSAERNGNTGISCKPIKNDLQYNDGNVYYAFTCGRFHGDGRYSSHRCQNTLDTCLRVSTLEEAGGKYISPALDRILKSIAQN